jgi:hypothetical protein
MSAHGEGQAPTAGTPANSHVPETSANDLAFGVTPGVARQEIDRNTTVQMLCRNFGVTDQLLSEARYNERDKALLAMVLNHRAMRRILSTLGFDGGTAVSKTKVVDFTGGLELSVEKVLQAFDWTFDTYKHKVKWYSWAEDVATSWEWDETLPGKYLHSISANFPLLI